MQKTPGARARDGKARKKGLTAEEASAITARNQRESPFLRLPPEIRISIYEYALSIDRVNCANADRYYGPRIAVDVTRESNGRQLSLSSFTGISKTCRQTYAESALIIFKNTQFGAYWPMPSSRTKPFLSMLKWQQLESIRSWWGGAWKLHEITSDSVPFALLPGPKTLTIYVQFKPETSEKCEEEEARVRNMMCVAACRNIRVVFDYKNYRFMDDNCGAK